MSTFSQFGIGAKPPTDINMRNLVAGYQNFTSGIVGVSSGVSGALTAGVLTTIVDVIGSGIVKALSVWTSDTTSRTIRVKITIDSIVIYDQTTAAITTGGNGLNPIGILRYISGVGGSVVFEDLIFNNGYKVEIASSLTETDKLEFVNYHQLTS